MLIGILETGARGERLSDKYGSNADMLQRLLAATSPDFTFARYRIRDGVFPDSVTSCDGWMVTGSDHSVYEELPWMLKAEQFLRDSIAAHHPIVGICFGHQLVAKALGGRVIKSEKGWGIGLQTYELTSCGSPITLSAYHQDQVVEAPQNARVLGGSDFCPHAILAYENLALTFQAHPEFAPDFLETLILKDMAHKPEHADVVAQAQHSLRCKSVQSQNVAQWIADFFLHRRLPDTEMS